MPGGKGDVLPLAAKRQHLDHVLGAGGEPDERDVGTPVAETAGRVRPDVRTKLEPPLGSRPHKTRCDVLIQTAADARLKTDLEQLGFLVRALGRGGKRTLPVCEQLPGGGEQRLTCGCQLNAPPLASKQRKTELSLELADLLRESGLRKAQPFGRAREVKLLRHGHEVAQVAQVDVHSHELYQDVLPS
jgi:hypothetical protein